ncbi:hypothetical protein BMS3Bbin04_00212 [bacterium BMS3Bbin04]|nr:hypothetical protein BMS3Bbin04_00212 [bacterium BMS3Bbin04]
MSSDDQIYLSVCQSLDNLFPFGGGSESAQHLDLQGITTQPLGKCYKVLLREDCGRDENCDLFGILQRLERCPHRDFSLSEAYITHQQTVHGHRFFHVPLDFFGGDGLIGRVLEFKCRFHLTLPGGILTEGISSVQLTFGVYLEDFLRQFLDSLLSLAPRFVPFPGPDLGQLRLFALGPLVSLQFGELVEADVNLDTVPIFNLQHFLLVATNLNLRRAEVATYAEFLVNDQVPTFDLLEE